MATPGELFPGVAANATEPDEVVAVKGDLRMVDVIAEAVRRRAADDLLRPSAERRGHGHPAAATARARGARARRRTRAPHNAARVTFVTDVLRRLLGALARRAASISTTRCGPG